MPAISSPMVRSGDIVSVNMRVSRDSIPERGDGRIWQGIRKNGANPMTIPGGHAIGCHVPYPRRVAEGQRAGHTRIEMWSTR